MKDKMRCSGKVCEMIPMGALETARMLMAETCTESE